MTAGLFVLAWLFVPELDFLVEPVTPSVRDEITQAIDAISDPAEQARLRLDLAALEEEDAARRSSLRSTIAQVGTALLAGGAAAWGAMAAWRQLQHSRQEAEAARRETAEQLRIGRQQLEDNRIRFETAQHETEKQMRIARDGQLTERFTRAVDQLGQDSLDVRLGGVYALERIARDSEMDRSTVIEVLAAFVRGHSQPSADTAKTESDSQATGRDHEFVALPRRTRDVQAALTVLGRMERDDGSPMLDLSDTALAGAELMNADLRDANLTGTDLARANLRNADLRGATLLGANLRRADLTDARLDRANLNKAELKESILVNAELCHTGMSHADLSQANLDAADLRRASLWYANLSGAYLVSADLSHASLWHADLVGAFLANADLRGADLKDADFDAAIVNASTRWPKGFDPKAAGVFFDNREESKPQDDGAADA